MHYKTNVDLYPGPVENAKAHTQVTTQLQPVSNPMTNAAL
jgi:hypothetical protein